MRIRFPTIESRKGTFLPRQYWFSHELCFFIHDTMGHMLAAGERAGAFGVQFQLRDDEVEAFNKAEDIFQWLERYRSPEDRAAVLVATVFPAILSDMLHCIYESLETSRKAKLGVSFMLLRKPIQESLYVLEAAIADRDDFAKKLTDSPIKLWSQRIGGPQAHRNNIAVVLRSIGDGGAFNADYLAQLRYDKSAQDGFDGICNKAMHLFTDHKAIVTEPMNINFIFSNWDSKESQWSYLYSRLPYILAYTYRIVENVCASISPTYPAYLEDLERRLSAHILLWAATLDEMHASGPLLVFVAKQREWLFEHCETNGYRAPKSKDIVRMRATGAFPGECRWSVWQRMRHFQEASEASGSSPPTIRTRVLSALGLSTLTSTGISKGPTKLGPP
jgi:hypothetical protein